MGRMTRLAAACAFAAALPAAALAAGSGSDGAWAQPQIALVTSSGLFAGTPATFQGGDPLTQGALAAALAKLTGAPATAPADGAADVTMEQLDRALVDALGLRDTAYRFWLAARRAGLNPPRRFGTEVVARLLGLRLNHPAAQDDLELQPQQTATRAEAAYSFAQILGLAGATPPAPSVPPTAQTAPAAPAVPAPLAAPATPPVAAAAATPYGSTSAVQQVKAEAQAFALPPLTPWQARILATAFSYVGYPYVWGGTGDGTAGFDCSGFVWRVYKLTAYPDEGDLAGVLRGRTTMEMSAEVPRSQRIAAADLEPGDVMFFGRGPTSKPAQVDHAAIYVGNGWLVQSSGEGVALAPFDGWYARTFAWARRPLAEAALEDPAPAT